MNNENTIEHETLSSEVVLPSEPVMQCPAPVSESQQLMTVIERIAVDPNADIDKLERLLDMQERIMNKNAEKEFNTSLANMQSEIPEIKQNGKIGLKGGGTQNKYAKFEDINNVVKPILQQHGFAISFRVSHQESLILIKGVLVHTAGHREETTIRLPQDTSANKNNVQGVGSSISYGKRYAMCALLNITTRDEDDDGNASTVARVISQPQANAIIGLLNDTDSIQAFCEKYEIPSINKLPVEHFELALARIHQRNNKKIAEEKEVEADNE